MLLPRELFTSAVSRSAVTPISRSRAGMPTSQQRSEIRFTKAAAASDDDA